jgi:hypothetical protein
MGRGGVKGGLDYTMLRLRPRTLRPCLCPAPPCRLEQCAVTATIIAAVRGGGDEDGGGVVWNDEESDLVDLNAGVSFPGGSAAAAAASFWTHVFGFAAPPTGS